MPRRTLPPLISTTVRRILSPTRIASPVFRVKTNIRTFSSPLESGGNGPATYRERYGLQHPFHATGGRSPPDNQPGPGGSCGERRRREGQSLSCILRLPSRSSTPKTIFNL